MAKTQGTQLVVGLGIESLAVPGTAVAETIFIPWMEYSLQGVSEKSMFTSARGLRIQTSDSMIRRRYSQGSIAVVPNVAVAPYFFAMALGSVSSSGVSDSAYTHTIEVQNDVAAPITATISAERGAVETAQYKNCVCDTLSLEVSDDYAKMTMGILGAFPGTDSITEAFTDETQFAYHQMTAAFSLTVAGALTEDALALKSFNLDIANNVQLDDAFLSGFNTITSGGLLPGRLVITGSYSLHFTDTTELEKYRANTKHALVVTFLGDLIGASSQETIQIALSRLVLTTPPVESALDGLIVLNQEFEVEYNDVTDTAIGVTIINAVNNASTRVYDKA